MSFLLPILALWKREFLRFWREKARVLGFVAPPLLFWVVIGAGFGNLEGFFPGALTLTVMFSAVFSMMSLIEDRREGFLLSMLVSPAPRITIVLGKVIGAALLAWVQGLLFLAFAAFTHLHVTFASVAVLLAISITFTALGFIFAWYLDSTQGFHGVMNLLLMPMWLVSGSLFSAAGAHGWMQTVMQWNPLTYAVSALRTSLGGAPSGSPDLAITIACGIAFVVLAAIAVNRRTSVAFASIVLLIGCHKTEPLPVHGSVPRFQLTAETGGAFDSRTLEGSTWVADFIFTNCSGPCPRMSSMMRQIQEKNPGLKLVSFTVDPARDTPEALAAYGKRFLADPARWRFLTGKQEELNHLKLDIFKLGSVDGSLDHSTRFVLVDRRGQIRGFYATGDGDPVARVLADATRLSQENS